LGSFIFKDNRDKFNKEFEEKLDGVLMAVGAFVESEAKEELENDPRRIDTGRLRNSISFATKKSHQSPRYTSHDGHDVVREEDGAKESDVDEKNVVVVGTRVEYAMHIHEGTTQLTPNRFLKNAITKNEKQILDFFKKNLR
jgi:hypothetical protein